MRVTLILAVRGGPDAKSRCAHALPSHGGHALTMAMLADMLSVAAQVPAIGQIATVTPTEEIARLAESHGALAIREDAAAGPNAAFALGCAQAAPGPVLLMPGDLPEITTADFAALIAAHGRDGAVVLAPSASDAGTSAVMFDSTAPIAPAFGEDSFRRHHAAAIASGRRVAIVRAPTLAHDLDRKADFARLIAGNMPTATQAFLRTGAHFIA